MAHCIVLLTSSFLPTVLDEETAFTRSLSQTEKQVRQVSQENEGRKFVQRDEISYFNVT